LLKIKTTRFSEIDVKEEDIITLPAGLIGFPELKRYVLLDHDKESSPFKWLQSLDDGAIAFVLINPLLFRPNYVVEVNEAEIGELELESEEDAVISVIITMPSNPQNMTANLKAPLVFNLKNRKGRQVILNNPEYTTRHNIVDEVKKRADASGIEQVTEVIDRTKEKAETDKNKKKGVLTSGGN
jgi:flagellar assembly factor FliW